MTKTITAKPAAKATAKGSNKPVAAKPAKGKVDKDRIVASTAIGNGDNHLVKSAGGKELIIPTARWAGDIRKASAVGASFAALDKLWAESNVVKLARGVDSRAAPHASKAVADNAAKRKGAAKAAPAAKGKADKPVSKAKAERQNVSASHDRTYKVLNKDHGARPDSKRAKQLAIVFAHTSTAAARAKGAESCDFRFAADKGFIKFA